ncbi:hypothetical protein WR25_21733 [Diploscapter pachys]|uniref:Thymidylate kinase n=1 Tax=Diploscapter pachys TaxID=2018661 RepID=A0A2A2M088_9BILA|nr:hypothetical protein WR25_21733 [Diploscapter pachys]
MTNSSENGTSGRGALIVFEGMDRSGKSTQARRLLNHINATTKHGAILQPFPDRNEPIGQLIDRYLKREIDFSEKALHLAFSANRWQKEPLILETIDKGVDVICDRYAFSGVAYSMAKGLDRSWVRQSDVGLPRPDIVLYFEVSPEVAKSRGGFGEERLEKEELQRNVAKEMQGLRGENWIIINANNDEDTVERDVRIAYENIIKTKELGKLTEI